ncbi:MAG: hypothetical protein IT303_01760 [Dehalococcoidia bacterium]|nr:hypothetical protein [Dehalococcoidia bacterium]
MAERVKAKGGGQPETVDIEEWLRGEGFAAPAGVRQARAALEANGLTNPRKNGMSRDKLARARAVLAAQTVRVCSPACAAMAEPERPARVPADAEPNACEVCRGSNNRRAAQAMIAACAARGVRRLLVLGGSGSTLRELASLLADSAIELRVVDGLERTPNKKDAIADLEWADLMVVWASTPLPHRVSVSYTDERPPRLWSLTVARRGVEALCTEVVRHLER